MKRLSTQAERTGAALAVESVERHTRGRLSRFRRPPAGECRR